MKERDDELEDLFRERFSEKETPISPRVWNNIKNSLPPEGKDKKGFWKKPKNFFAIAIGALLTGAGIWWLLSTDPQKKELTLSNANDPTVVESRNRNDEKLNNGSDKINISENQKDAGLENTVINTNETTDNSDTDRKRSADGTKAQTGKKETTVDSGVDNSKNDQENRRGTQKVGLAKELTNKNQTRKNSVDNGIKANRTVTGVLNNGGDHKDKPNQKNITSYEEKGHTKKNSTLSENSQKDNINKAIADGKNNEQNQQLTNKDKSSNNHLVAGVDGDSKQENPSKENGMTNDEGKNKGSFVQNKSEDQKTETIPDPLTTAFKENEKLHELIMDSSVSATQKEHAPAEQNNVTNNFENKKENNAIDSIADAPVIVAVTRDSIQPVVDTVVTAAADSTSKVDSTVKKEKEEEKPSKPSRWSVDLVMGPMLTGASTHANDLAYREIVNAKNEQDKNLLNFSGGAMVNYSLSSKFYVSSGIMYSGYSEKYNFKNTKDLYTIDSHIEYDSVKIGQDTTYTQVPRTVYDTTNVSSVKYSDKKKDQYSFISVPLQVSMYLWRKEKISLLASVGIRANLIMKHTTYISNSEMTKITEYSGGSIHKLTLSYAASVALEYKLKKKIFLLVQPTINYQAGSIYTKSSVLNQKPYSVGMNVGVRFKF